MRFRLPMIANSARYPLSSWRSSSPPGYRCCYEDEADMEIDNPIEAVTHRDPYPYYESLTLGSPLKYDAKLRLWIAARASTVTEVFGNPACRVRPATEPVPAPIVGSPAGEIFSQLVRMNDGTPHRQTKLALERGLATLPLSVVDSRSSFIARVGAPTRGDGQALTAWMSATPVTIVADLLGFEGDERSEVAHWIRNFVACLSPLSNAEQLSAASNAASLLQIRMRSLLNAARLERSGRLALMCAEYEAAGGFYDTTLIANLIGILSQSYEATAGLIGNAIIALASHPDLINEVRSTVEGWDRLVQETGRYDSPVQNTRRFVVEQTRISGIELEPGAVVLLILAAANRDPGANLSPNEFRLDRPHRCVFTFSRGAHACPGQTMAQAIASAALRVLFESLSFDSLGGLSWTWRPSTNGRIPVFHSLLEE